MNHLTQHLKDINEGYFQHLLHAFKFSAKLLLAALVCLVHGLFPFLCVKTGSRIINELHNSMVTHRDGLSKTPKASPAHSSQLSD